MEVRERYYRTLDSTNNEAKKQAQTHCPEGTVISAGRQTAGRGRRGHDWETPQDEAVATSMILYPDIPPEHLPGLTLLAAVAVRRAISGLYGLEGQIKWPNDIVVNGKKLVGILTEMSAQVDYINHVTVGVGINVNTTEFPEEISRTATSLRLAPIIASIMERLEANYETFLRTEDLTGLMDRYSSMLVNRGREVKVIGVKETYRAHALGITPEGELVVRREDGREEKINAGEVSVRGVYGYV